MTEPLLKEGSGLTSMTLTVPGHEPVVLNKESARKIKAKADDLKKGAKA